MIYLGCYAEVNKVTTLQTYSYEHKEQHFHTKPPEGKAHPQHIQLLYKTIQNNPNTLPHALRIGSVLPTKDISLSLNNTTTINNSLSTSDSAQSIGKIAPQFNNLSRVFKI